MNLALFDFDGTITSGDTWTPFMRFAVRPARMAVGYTLLLPIVAGYRLGVVPASRGREAAVRVAFRGESAAHVRQLGSRFAVEVIPSTLRPVAVERIAWHQAHGDQVVVVSASLVYVHPWCETRGLACICTTLEERDGRLTGRCVEGDCSGAEKARRIRQQYELGRYAVIYAYGDTTEDREMIELAHEKYYRYFG